MKVIITLISIIGFQYITIAQSASKHKVSPSITKAKCSVTAGASEVTITSIPAVTETLNSVIMQFEMKGSFSFKKDKALEIPFNHEVFIEDKLTGRIFNLKASEAYTFNSEENAPNRFVMHVLDKTNMDEALSVN